MLLYFKQRNKVWRELEFSEHLTFCYCRKSLLRSSSHPHVSQPQFLQRKPPSGCSFYFLQTLQPFFDNQEKKSLAIKCLPKPREGVMLLRRQLWMPRALDDTRSVWVASFLLLSLNGCLKCRWECGKALACPTWGTSCNSPGQQKGGQLHHADEQPKATAPEELRESANSVTIAFTKEPNQKPATQAQGQHFFTHG